MSAKRRPRRPDGSEGQPRPDRAERPPRPDRADSSPRPDRAGARRRPPRPPDDAPDPATTLYGRNPVREALRAGRRHVHRIWATDAAVREPWLAAPATDVPVEIAGADEIARRAGSDAHQGVCARADPYPYADAAALLARPPWLLVALDEVQDPQNLGAIVRTAEAAGADGVVIPQRRAAQVTAAVAKASAGAVEHLPMARVRNLADFLGDAKAAGGWVYGAAADGTTAYDEPDWSGSVVLVLGAESSGLRPRVAGACDALVALPMRGRVASLNVSAAAAALLYAILQSRTRA